MSGINLQPGEVSLQRFNLAIRQLMQGRSNATGSCTLTANATSTTVSAPNCGSSSAVFLFPQTANAAGAVATTYVAPANVTAGQFIVTHAGAATSDRTFFFVCLG